jgi:hypothetical protein
MRLLFPILIVLACSALGQATPGLPPFARGGRHVLRQLDLERGLHGQPHFPYRESFFVKTEII